MPTYLLFYHSSIWQLVRIDSHEIRTSPNRGGPVSPSSVEGAEELEDPVGSDAEGAVIAAPMSAGAFLDALRDEGVTGGEDGAWRDHHRNHNGPWGPVHGV